jgi:glucose dehydrogenase
MRKAVISGLIALGLALVAGTVCAGTATTTQYTPQQGFPDHDGDFSAMLIIIPQQELAEFDKSGGGNRQLNRVSRAEVGAVLAIKLVFTGLAADANGNGEVTYDLQVLGPDAKVYADSDYKTLAAVRGPVGDGKSVFDNRTKVVMLQFEPHDAPGIYTIKAVAHDEVSERRVPLETQVELIGKGAPVVAAAPATVMPEAAAEEKPAVTKKKVKKKRYKASRRSKTRR